MRFFTCVDGYITPDHCAKYIEYYEANKERSYCYGDTKPLTIQTDDVVERIISDFGINNRLDNLEIVKRSAPSEMKNHYDDGDAVAFLLYLNENFTGGYTVFEDETEIVPKTGRLLVFSNGDFLHKVTKIQSGDRYVMAGWFN